MEVVIPHTLSPVEAVAAVRSNGASPATVGRDGWETIFATDFSEYPIEADFDIFDLSSTGQVWGDALASEGCPTASGSFSAGIAQGGSNGVACGTPYDPNIHTAARYGPFDLSDADEAEVVFKVWMDMDVPRHTFGVGASRNGNNFWVDNRTTNTAGFESMALDLATFPVDGTPVIGESQVWIAFWAEGDGLGGSDLGAFIDEIEIRKQTAGTEPQIAVHPTSLTLTEPGARVWTTEPGANRVDLDQPLDDHVPGRVIVGFREGVEVDERSLTTGFASIDQFAASIGVTEMRPLFIPTAASRSAHAQYGFDRVFVMEFERARDVRAVIRELTRIPEVEFAEPDFLLELDGDPPHRSVPPNDPLYANQWALRNTGQAISYYGTTVGTPGSDINAEPAWQITTGDPNVVIAIIDSGVDLGHPEFAGRLTPGWDFIENNDDAGPKGGSAHGTASAGVAAAAGNNAIGVAGVSWNTGIMPLRVCDGGCPWSAVASAITWAADNGARVISMSLGGETGTTAGENAVNYAYSQGVTLLGSRGNENNTLPRYPSSYTHVISVGAMSPCDTRKSPSSCDGEYWWGSSYGAGMDFLTPGTRIHTTDIRGSGGYTNGDYTSSYNGTSAACPFAAGVAALLLSADPTLTPDEVRSIMQSTAVDLGPPGYDIETGFGRVDAGAAVQAVFQPGAGSFTISNEGGGVLQVSSVSADAGWLSVDPAGPITISGGQSQAVSVSVDWSQLSVESTATITISSNDTSAPSVEVDVTAIPALVSPPVAHVSPGSLSFELVEGESGEAVLTLSNDAAGGSEALTFTASVQASSASRQPVAAVSPGAGSVSAGGSAELTVSVDASAEAGSFAFEVLIETNDPESAEIVVPVTVVVSPADLSVPVALSSGWSIVSVPVAAADMSAEELFPEAVSGFFAFDGAYSPVTQLATGSGYWVRFDEDITTTLTGQPVSSRTVQVSEGWNLIGLFETEVPVADLFTTPAGIIGSNVFSFDGTYQIANVLAPGRGYWVFATEDGEINGDPALHRSADGDASVLALGRIEEDEVGSLTITDAAGRSSTLVFMHGGADGAHYLLPPAPPEDVFDVRFATDRSGADLGLGRWEVRLAGVTLPATFELDGLPGVLRLQDGMTGHLFDVELQEGQATSLDVPLTHLHLSYSVLPDDESQPVEFELGAAYPNPATSSTTIGYSVPEAAYVRLAIYDVLGRLIVPLIDEEVEAGIYELTVPLDGLASGVYLYRIEAGAHRASGRLTVAR